MKFKLGLILIFFAILSISAVSANDSVQTDIIDSISDNSIILADNNQIKINSSNYNAYFNDDGVMKNISDGDKLVLSGEFDQKKFVINKNVSINGENVLIKNGTIVLLQNASGSIISNLKIINDGNNIQGILLEGATNCLIINNNISSKGTSSFPIALNPGSNYNTISNNTVVAGGINAGTSTKSTCAIVLGGANYNTIKNNYVQVDDANAIYLSVYGSGSFKGGKSDFNTIYNNTVKCNVVPTSWCYGIQMMGSNNKADSNTIIGTYRGISAEDHSNITNNKLINITGKNFATGVLVGGDYAIVAGSNSIISNNTLINCMVESAGIYAADNTIVKDNKVDINGTGYGINANGNNVKIINNTVKTTTGAGVYQAGKLSNLVVDKNHLNSDSGIGVLLKKTSSTKIPNGVTITNNVISTKNEYAINAQDANKTSFTINNNNVGSSKILTPSGEIVPTPDFNFNGKVYNITNDTYHSFFDEKGNMIKTDVKDGDILNFTGEFENKTLIISLSVKIIGNNVTFKNSKFNITSDGVWIERIKINNSNSSFSNAWGIYAADIKNLMIVNNSISVYDKNAAYAIYLNAVSKATIQNNNLSSSGDYLTYPVLLYGVENSVIENNNILANGTGQVHGYEPNKCLDGVHSVNEIFRTYGILLIYSSDNQVNFNNVFVTSKLNQSNAKINGSLSTNSLVGIDAYFDSNSNEFNENTVVVKGNDNYIYGMGLMGAETGSGSSQYSQFNKLTNNNITVIGENVATGIISGYNTKNNEFTGNNIEVTGNNSAYGITFEYAKESTLSNNNILLKGDVSYGIEMFEGDKNVISNNAIETSGVYGFGVAGYNSNNNKITSNQITVNGTGDKKINTSQHADALGFGNAGVFFMKNSTGNMIGDNIIISTKNQAVNLTGVSNNSVINNYLKGEKTSGNDAVEGAANNIVKDNYNQIFNNSNIENANVGYLGEVTLKANSGIVNDNVTTVKFYVNGKYVGQSKTNKGITTLKVKVTEEVGVYVISAEFSRPNYKSVNSTAKLTITKGNVIVDLLDAMGKKGTGVLLKAIVKDTNGNLVKNMEVLFYRGDNYIGKATTNDNGLAQFKWNIPSSISSQSDSIKAVASGNNNYNGANGTATVTYVNIINTEIVLNDLVMYYKNGTRLEAVLTDLNDNPIANTAVVLVINGVSYSKTTDKNGKFSSAINLNPGIYKVSAKFAGNKDYLGSDSTASVTVLSTVQGNNHTLYFKNGTKYDALFLDGKGNPLKNTRITFNINGQMYERTTNSQGFTTGLTINLRQGTYIITATNPLNGQQYSNTIVVLPTLIASNLVKFYKNGSQFEVKALDKHGKPLAGQTITFNINGLFYTRTTNSDGIAIFTINLAPGEYVITSECNGCTVSNIVNVLPVISGENFNTIYQSGGKFNVKVVDGQGKPQEGVAITFNINGMFYHRVSDATGFTSGLTINLQPGSYIITSSRDDNGATISNRVTVTV